MPISHKKRVLPATKDIALAKRLVAGNKMQEWREDVDDSTNQYRSPVAPVRIAPGRKVISISQTPGEAEGLRASVEACG